MTVRFVPVKDPATLRELAAVIERRQTRPHLRLCDEKLAEMADTLLRGDRPTLGWWIRALPVDDDHAERMAAARDDVARLRNEWNAET